MDKHNLFHPPLHVKKFKDYDEILIINCIKNGKFDIAFLDAGFKDPPKSMVVPVKDFSKFLDSPACRSLKAVIFVLVDYDNIYGDVNLENRQMVYEEVRKRKWPIYLVHPLRLSIMSILLASKIYSKPGDVILNVSSTGPMVDVSELQRKQEEYAFISDRNINQLNRNIDDVTTECLGVCDPKYVIVFDPQNIGLLMSLKSRFVPSKKFINIAPESYVECIPQALKTILEGGYYQIIPVTYDILAVMNASNSDYVKEAVFTVEGFEELPLEKARIVPKSNKPYSVSYLDETSGTYKPVGKAQLSKEQEGHRIKLDLVVDRNSLPFLYQEPCIIPEIEALPQKLATQPDLNVPVIGFFDNSSVICVRNENEYMFLNEWNGLYGYDLYLSFEEEVPTIVTDLNNVKNKDPFVVYDLIKILSMPAENLKVDPKWGFKLITDDPKHSILLEHDTFLGTRKSQTPIFLMALILKHHIKAIKNETGKKPKKLGFCLFNDFAKEEKKRIHTGLEEACKLLKIDFVIVPNV